MIKRMQLYIYIYMETNMMLIRFVLEFNCWSCEPSGMHNKSTIVSEVQNDSAGLHRSPPFGPNALLQNAHKLSHCCSRTLYTIFLTPA